MLHHRLAPAVPKLWEKKEQEIVFRLLWNNINQQMMVYRDFIIIKNVITSFIYLGLKSII
jgi:hypothetical protein